MDEFEFKPLTQGLGFHKKQITLKEDEKAQASHTPAPTFELDEPPQKSSRVSENFFSKPLDTQKDYNARPLEDLMSSFPKMEGLDFLEEDLNINQKAAAKPPRSAIMNNPLPRHDLTSEKQIDPVALLQWREPELKIAPEVFQIPQVSNLTPAVAPLKITEKRKATTVEKARSFQTASPKVSAYLIDILVMIGLTNIFMAVVLFVTKVDVIFVLMHPQTSFVTKFSVFALFYVLALMYQMVARAIAGCTLGEWCVDMQLGTSEQQAKTLYPVRVVHLR